ncbi:MAG: hypothetical protein U0Z26_03905 [Anaerolineales bacterium]
MENNNTSSLSKYYGFIAIIIVVIVSFLSNTFFQKPLLSHYAVTVNSLIQEGNFQQARVSLENEIFQSVNNSIAQNTNLTYSEALDKLLPISKNIANPESGIVVVVQNSGKAPAHNVQININLQTPLEKYTIVSKDNFSILSEDKSSGLLRIVVDKIEADSEINIVILLSNKYPVALTALRNNDLIPPVVPTSLNDPMQMIEILAKQTEVANYNNGNITNLLEFQVSYDIDKILPEIVIVSDEGQSQFLGTKKNERNEQNLFIETFQK